MTTPNRVKDAPRRPAAAALRTAALCLAVATGLVGLSGCSGADPKDVAKIADADTASDGPLAIPLEKNLAECRARIYLESNLSDQAIDAIKRGQPPAPKTKEDIEILAQIAEDIATDCIGTS